LQLTANIVFNGCININKAFKFLIAVGIFLLLFHTSQLQFGLLNTIIRHPSSTAAVIVLCLVMVLLTALRWRKLNLAQGIVIPLRKTLLFTYVGVGLNTVLPGSVGGDFVKLLLVVKKFPEKKSAASLSILVDRISGLLGVILIASVTAPYYLHKYPHNDVLYYTLMSCISVFLGCAITFCMLCALLSEKSLLSQNLRRIFNRSRYSAVLIALLEAIHIYRNAKLIIAESLILSVATQLLLLAVIVIINNMMEFPDTSYFDFLLALALGQIANLIPLTPGGIGIGEAAFANILLILNPGSTVAYATVFLAMRLLSTAAYLPGALSGIFCFNLLKKTKTNHLGESSI
jgi:uncharacterized protein (TIRG00374 family)